MKALRIPLILGLLIGILLIQPASAGIVVLSNLINPGFEDGLNGWTLTGKAGDKVVCQGDKNHNDYSGMCGFLFKGNADSSAKLKTTVKSDLTTQLNSDLESSNVMLALDLRRYSESAASKLVARMIVSVEGGLPYSVKITASGPTLMPVREFTWRFMLDTLEIPQGTVVQSIKVKIIDRSKSGKQWIDDIYAGYSN